MSGAPDTTRISIITPVLNRRELIASAIESLMAQNFEGVEHIVVDGGSTDGTIEFLRKYPHLRVISEPDQNLYAAMNKGIEASHGDIIGILGSDDLLPDGALAAICRGFDRHHDAAMITGGIEVFVDTEMGERLLVRQNDVRLKHLRERDVVGGITLTNARFFRRWVFEQIGLFDPRFPLGADRDFLMRFLLANLPRATVPGIVYRYRQHKGSLSFAGPTARLRLAEDYTRLAGIRHDEFEAGSIQRRAYCRWLVWAAGYLAYCHLRGGHPRAMWSAIKQGFSISRAWPLTVLGMALVHISERSLRKGQPGSQT